MYKYLCVVSESADENAFYDTIEKIKGFYPHFEYAEQLVDGSLEKIITIPDERGNPSQICIRMDSRNAKTIVMSEAYLSHIFYGRAVENISKYKGLPVRLLLSAAFLTVNIFAIKGIQDILIIFLVMPWLTFVHIAPLMIVYFLSAWGMKKAMGLPPSKILFTELGGYFLAPFYAVLLIWAVIENSLRSVSIVLFGVRYIVLLLPAAALSVLIADKITSNKN